MAGDGGAFATTAAMETAAERWWDRRFSAFSERIPFKSLFFPLLLQVCDEQQQSSPSQQNSQLAHPSEQLSQDERAAIVKHCLAENAWKHGFVTKQDFLYFVARFGPLELTISKVVSCFCVNGELVPWFHGLLGRADADRVLASHSPSGSSPTSAAGSGSTGDGTFLIRFSESHPTKFTLSYVKIHTAPPHKGRREMKNCLIENLGLSSQQLQGRSGSYVLTDSRSRAYASILSFVQRSAAKLKHGVPSAVAKHCNSELADIRALQDQQSNSYTAFSAETFDMSGDAPVGSASVAANRSLLFAPPSPVLSSKLQLQASNSTGSSTGSSNDCCADSYSGFTLDTLTPPLSIKTTSAVLVKPPQQRSAAASDDYGDVGQFFSEKQPVESTQQSRSAAPKAPAVDGNADYGSFVSFATESSKASSPVATSHSPSARPPVSPSSRIPQQSGFMLLSPSRLRHQQQQLQQKQGKASSFFSVDSQQQRQDDAYGTFESFASTFAAESEELAQRNRQAISFSKMNLGAASSSSFASTCSSLGSSSMGCDDPYGSFASVSVTMPSTSTSVNSSSFSSNNSSNSEGDTYGSADYGNFASFFTESEGSQQQQQQHDEFSLGPPPPPLASQFKLKTQPSGSDGGGDTYGSFATLLSSSDNQEDDDRADGSSVYGQFQLEMKAKHSVTLAQASTASVDDDNQQEPAHQEIGESKEPVHAHSAACSALEELNAGMACYRDKQLEAALLRFTHAREVARVTDDKVVEARALGNLGTVYLDMKNPQQAVVCYQRCLDITRSIKDTKRERTILNNLVLALMASESFERALECCHVQLEMTTNEINRHKIFERMSLLREKAARERRERSGLAARATQSL